MSPEPLYPELDRRVSPRRPPVKRSPLVCSTERQKQLQFLPALRLLVEKALANGAEAAKICGAGGGGCIAFLCDPKRKPEVARALAAEEGTEILDWKVSREGLIVSEK